MAAMAQLSPDTGMVKPRSWSRHQEMFGQVEAHRDVGTAAGIFSFRLQKHQRDFE